MAKLDECPVCSARVVIGLALCDGDTYKCEKGHALVVTIDEEAFKVALVPK